VVTDPGKRKALAELYNASGDVYLPLAHATAVEQGDKQSARVYDSALFLNQIIADVPVHVIPCMQGRLPENADNATAASMYGSIFPAVWSFQLALRSRGLGSTLTTIHLFKEAEAAKLLGIPDDYSQVGLLPVAYTKGVDFKHAERPAPETITHFEGW
jgi:nitroreductase